MADWGNSVFFGGLPPLKRYSPRQDLQFSETQDNGNARPIWLPTQVGLPVEVQVMLKTLIAKLAKSLFRPKYNPGYQTRVYPRLGEMIVSVRPTHLA